MKKGTQKEIEVEVFLRFNENGLKIEIGDTNANIRFLEIQCNAEETLRLMSGVKGAKQKATLRGLEYVGKTHQHDSFKFVLPKLLERFQPSNERKEYWKAISYYAQTLVDRERPNEGWIVDPYFGSQSSFYAHEGVSHVKATIRRYV